MPRRLLSSWWSCCRGFVAGNRARTARSGSVLLTTLYLFAGLGTAIFIFFLYQALAVRMIQARNVLTRTTVASEAVARVMAERLIATAEHKYGVLTQADLDSLNSTIRSIPVADGVTVDLGATRYQVTRVGVYDVLPYDASPLAVTTEQPRTAHTVDPLVTGRRATRVIEVAVIATVEGARAGRRTTLARFAVTKVTPYQGALLTTGDLELCVSSGSVLGVSGTVQANGLVRSSCGGDRVIAGDVLARDGIEVAPVGTHTLAYDGGTVALATLTRSGMEQAVEGTLAATLGRVRVGAALGDALRPASFGDAWTAGWGECADFQAACGGRGAYLYALQLQRTVSGTSTAFETRCGVAYGGQGCDAVRTAIRYVPFPFTTAAGALTEAWPDPTRPGQLWQGLFPDYRREGRCTATVGGQTFRTFRCPTNAYGYVIDLAQLPPIPGGLLSILKATTTSSLSNSSGFQEVVLLRNAAELSGPLTIHSQLPVYIEGSFNTVQPKAAMVDAPLITMLPTTARVQLRTAALWDSTAMTPPLMLTAYTPEHVRGVLRAPYHPTSASGYFGGTIEQIPSVLGHWGAVALHVRGTIEGVHAPVGTPGSYSTAFAPYGVEPSEMRTVQPRARRLTADAAFRSMTRQPFGSYRWENIPAGGAGGTRTAARQREATGGVALVRLLQDFTPVASVDLPAVAAPPSVVPTTPTAAFIVEPSTTQPAGAPFVFDASTSTDLAGITAYHWQFGDGTTARGVRVTKAYPASGVYQVTLTVVNGAGRQAVQRKTVQVPAAIGTVPPVASFAHTPATPLRHQTVSFDGSASSTVSGATITRYAWAFSDGVQTVGAQVSKSFADTGQVSATLTVTDSRGLTATSTHTFRVADPGPPVAQFTMTPSPGRANERVTFDASSSYAPSGTIVDYTWQTGNGAQTTGVRFAYAYPMPGTYTVTLTVTDNTGATASVSQVITIHPGYLAPTAVFTVQPTPAVVDRATTFDGRGSTDPDGSLVSYFWDFGDWTTASGSVVSKTYTAQGDYVATLQVTDNDGFQATATQTVPVQEAPTAAFTWTPTTPIVGDSVAFDASASQAGARDSLEAFQWDFGDWTTGTGVAPTHVYAAHGWYRVLLTVTGHSGVSTTAIDSLYVNAPPAAAIAASQDVPTAGDTVTFSPEGSYDVDGEIVAYQWTVTDSGGTETVASAGDMTGDVAGGVAGDGARDALAGDAAATSAGAVTAGLSAHAVHALTWVFQSAGRVTVSLTVVDNFGATATATRVLRVNAPPTAAYTAAPVPALVGVPVTFDASSARDMDGAIEAYAWDLGNGRLATGRTTTYTYSQAGTYTVTLTVRDNDGVLGRVQHAVRVNTPPVATFAVTPVPPIVGEPAVLDASAAHDPDGTIASWSWDFGDWTQGNGRTVTHAWVEDGEYTVALTVTDNDGTARTTTQRVATNIHPQPTFTVTPRVPTLGTAVTLDATATQDPDGQIATYDWTFGDGAGGTGRTVTKAYARAGRYPVTLTVRDDEGAARSVMDTVVVNQPPTAAFTYAPTPPAVGRPITFTAQAADADGQITALAWDFGDWTTSTEPQSVKTYLAGGAVTVTLTVTDNHGARVTAARTLALDLPPQAEMVWAPEPPTAGDTAVFDGTRSRDLDGRVVQWVWTFDDGSTASGAIVAKVFATPGAHTATLTVTDTAGVAGSVTQAVAVNAPPRPVFQARPFPSVRLAPWDSLFVDGSASYDPDGEIVAASWTFADGKPGLETAVGYHAFDSVGVFPVTLTVRDNHGGTRRETQFVQVMDPGIAMTAPGEPLFMTNKWRRIATTGYDSLVTYHVPIAYNAKDTVVAAHLVPEGGLAVGHTMTLADTFQTITTKHLLANGNEWLLTVSARAATPANIGKTINQCILLSVQNGTPMATVQLGTDACAGRPRGTAWGNETFVEYRKVYFRYVPPEWPHP